ncbi:Sec-independent protein translocase protein TatB [Bartonella sp. HY329]|uniref:Sec-independent protein translocase protein TatB n=1 Tax=unclassified Bartonella TaxID=2645622 RepID=UPI0021C9A50F|nr:MULTISPECIES: Sec-independent protein translocase protein TatB [unclassified Bartonella]UXM96260.1 Sec-independent protein translocase protein TatB [Bartonella sp. HY329]UXN10584.1 Sec-independent protein translocase protein TatB [Bartonella sp. HY328]
MFGIGWSEFLVIAIVAIIVIGPKDLPKVMRSLGKATAKMRSTAAEFRQQFDDAMKDAELDDVKSALDEVRNLDPRRSFTQVFDPFRDAANDVKQSLSQTNDALKGIASPSLKDQAILDSSNLLPPANYHDDDNYLMSEKPHSVNQQDHYAFDASPHHHGKGVKRHASFEMKRPLRKHRLKHNSGRFSRNSHGKKAAYYFERSIKSPPLGQIFNNKNGAQSSDE